MRNLPLRAAGELGRVVDPGLERGAVPGGLFQGLLNALRRTTPIALAFNGLVIMVAIIGLLAYRQNQVSRAQDAWVEHTRLVQIGLKDIGIAFRDAEAGQRGYLLTGTPGDLVPYQTAIQRLWPAQDEIKRLTDDNPRQQQAIEQLTALGRKKLEEMARTVRLRADLGEAEANRILLSSLGQDLTGQIDSALDAMQAEESRLLVERTAAAEQAATAVGRLCIGGTALAAIFLGIAGELLRRSIARLRRSETDFRVLAEHASDVVARVSADGTQRYASPAAVRLFGRQPEALLGQSIGDLSHPDHQPELEAFTQRLLGGDVVEDKMVFSANRADGSEIWIEVMARVAPHPDTGAPDGYIAIMRDVTERQLANAQLQESEARYRLLTDTTTDLITSLTLKLRRTYVSPACRTMFGYEPEEMISTPPLSMVHPEDVEGVGERLRGLAAGESDKDQLTYRARHKDGRWVWCEARCSLVRDPATGAPASIICSMRDLAERMANTELERLARRLAKALEQAEQANQAKSRFLASMSHELRTPLNGILGYAELMHVDGDMTAKQQTRVTAMLQAGQHLLEMINRVLDLSEIEAKMPDLKPVEFEVRAELRACADMVRPMAEAKGLAIHMVVGPNVPSRMVADPGRLRQVLLNVLGNAVKFTARGSVELRMLPAPPRSVRIEIADTGPGIPRERRHRLFQDFARETGNNPAEGAGLGLAISARLATAMGGRMGYDDNPGGGSLFWLELPAGAVGARAADAAAPKMATPAPETAWHVLVVDDLAMNRDIAGALLADAGHTVANADDGASGLEAAIAGDFDAVLMDVRMPGIDGLEATRRIRAVPGRRGRVPIIALTAQAFAEQIRECRRAGMDEHLAKPFTQAALLGILAKAIDTGRRSRSGPEVPEQMPSLAAPPPAAAPAGVAGLPVFDQAEFDNTAKFLERDSIDAFLRTLGARAGELLQGLRDTVAGRPVELVLVNAVHSFAGSSGMLGFQRVSAAARQYEREAEAGSMARPACTDLLIAALEASLEAIARHAPPLPSTPERTPSDLVPGRAVAVAGND